MQLSVVTHWKRRGCWEWLGAGREGDNRGWDGWMASLTWWTWVWVNSRSWWWTGRPGVLWFMGSQRVGHDWATDLIWSDLIRTENEWAHWIGLSCYVSHIRFVYSLKIAIFHGSDGKESACNAGDPCSIPGLGRSPVEGNGNPLQYSCLENPMDKGAWQATVDRVTQSCTRLEQLSTHAYT